MRDPSIFPDISDFGGAPSGQIFLLRSDVDCKGACGTIRLYPLRPDEAAPLPPQPAQILQAIWNGREIAVTAEMIATALFVNSDRVVPNMALLKARFSDIARKRVVAAAQDLKLLPRRPAPDSANAPQSLAL